MNSKSISNINKGEPIFPCKLCPKNVTDNDNAVTFVTSVKHGSLSNVTILTTWPINIYKAVMSHGIASLVPVHFFHFVS